MRMAWPERIVLIVLTAFVILAVEIAALVAAKEFRVPGGLTAFGFIVAVFLDIWLVLRTIDRMLAGPARRKRDRVVKFSP